MANRHKAKPGGISGRSAFSGGNTKVVSEAKQTGGSGKGKGSDKSPMSSAGGGSANKNPFSSAHRG